MKKHNAITKKWLTKNYSMANKWLPFMAEQYLQGKIIEVHQYSPKQWMKVTGFHLIDKMWMFRHAQSLNYYIFHFYTIKGYNKERTLNKVIFTQIGS